MISAGTIAAYLTLDATDFNRGIGDALKLLAGLCASGIQSEGVLGFLGSAAVRTAANFGVTLADGVIRAANGFKDADLVTTASSDSMRGRIIGAMEEIRSALTSVGSAAPLAGKGTAVVAEAIMTPLRGLQGTAYGIMSNVGSSLNSGLASKKGTIVSTAASIADSVTSTLKRALKIASPSKVMRKIGEQTAQGLAIGLDDIRPSVAKSADLLAESVTGRAYGAGAHHTEGMGISQLTERLDSLISVLSSGEQTMQVDGRTFARLIREYS